jgi:hypothetical protein
LLQTLRILLSLNPDLLYRTGVPGGRSWKLANELFGLRCKCSERLVLFNQLSHEDADLFIASGCLRGIDCLLKAFLCCLVLLQVLVELLTVSGKSFVFYLVLSEDLILLLKFEIGFVEFLRLVFEKEVLFI